MKQLGRYAGVGFELVMTILVGYLGGRFIDRHAGTHYLSWVGAAGGAVLGFRMMFRMAQMEARRLEKEDREKGPPASVSDEEFDSRDKDWGEDHRELKDSDDERRLERRPSDESGSGA